MKFYTNIDLKGNEIQNASVEKLSVAPENPTLGQTYYNTTDNLYYIYTNHGWETIAYASTNITAEEKEKFEAAFDHTQDLSNPHGTTKTHIGLPAVDNVKQAPYTHIGKGGSEHATATPAANGFMSSSDKGKLNGIEINAQRNVNPDWNAASGSAQILNKPTIPTKTSELINDSGFETPLGAQDKANQAEQNANYYTDTQLLNYDTTVQVENKIINSEIATKNYSDEQDLTTLGLANDYTDEEIAKINQMQIHDNSYHSEDYLVAADVMTKSDVGHTHDSLYEPKNENIQTHINQTDNPHQVSKSQIGLGNVENKSALDIINEITSTNILNALGFTPENSANKGIANGYAELDSTGKIPLSKLPDTSKQQTYVVLNSAARPTENLIIGDRYYETSTGDAYIWDGNSWLILTQADWENVNLEWANLNGKPISEVSAIDSAVQAQHTHTNKAELDNISAGKISNWESAFNHSEIIGANPHGTTKDQIGLGNLDNIKQAPHTHIGTGGTEHALASATTHGFMSSSDKAKLNGVQSGAEANVNADWNASSGDAQILNKPAILDPSHANLIASPTTLGHIKVGNNLTIDLDGKLHAEAGGGSADIVSYNNSISLLLAENVQDAIDEVVASLGDIDLSADNITESATRVWVSPTEKTTWNSKAAGDHTHADLHNHTNKTALDTISTEDVTAWDNKWDYDEATIQSVKVDSAINADTVNGLTVETAVPLDAKFTDTIYTHPATHSPSIITQDANNRFVTDAEKTTWNSKSNFSGSYTDLTNKPTIPTKTSDITNDSNFITASGAPVQSVAGRTGTVVLTKTDIGLTNVDNKSSATIRGEITSTNITSALGYTPLNSTLKGSNSGLAELDANGKVPSSQLPSYVDDVLEVVSYANLPISGETGKIYITQDTNKTYRWSGSGYVEIGPSIALGETSATAYRGDRGKVAYDHSQSAHAPSNAQKNSDITKAEIEAKLTGSISTHTHTLANITDSGNLAAINTNASTSNYLRGDGAWKTPPNTTYSAMSVAEGQTGNATSSRTMRADYLKQIIEYWVNQKSSKITASPTAPTGAKNGDMWIDIS